MNEAVRYRDEALEELINGEFVAMSPGPVWNHVSVSGNIYILFFNYLQEKPSTVISGRFDLHLTDKDVFIPDMMVICDREKIKFDGVHGTPDLVVEVISPSTAARDRGYKKDVYETSGVPEYWIVNPMDRSIEVYLLANGRFTLDDVYMLPPAEMESERDKFKTQLKCHLYDDLVLSLEDIFSDLL